MWILSNRTQSCEAARCFYALVGSEDVVEIGGRRVRAIWPAPPNLQQQKFQFCVVDIPLVRMAAFMADSKRRQERRKADEALAHAGPPGVPMARMGVQRTKAQGVPKTSPYVPQPPTNPMNRLKEQAQISQHPGSPKEARGPQQKFPPNPLNENTIDIMDTVSLAARGAHTTFLTTSGSRLLDEIPSSRAWGIPSLIHYI